MKEKCIEKKWNNDGSTIYWHTFEVFFYIWFLIWIFRRRKKILRNVGGTIGWNKSGRNIIKWLIGANLLWFCIILPSVCSKACDIFANEKNTERRDKQLIKLTSVTTIRVNQCTFFTIYFSCFSVWNDFPINQYWKSIKWQEFVYSLLFRLAVSTIAIGIENKKFRMRESKWIK